MLLLIEQILVALTTILLLIEQVFWIEHAYSVSRSEMDIVIFVEVCKKEISPVWYPQSLDTAVHGEDIGNVTIVEPIPRGTHLGVRCVCEFECVQIMEKVKYLSRCLVR